MPDDLPRVAQFAPYFAELEAGESYLWCSCGLSRNQPYCDQSHRGTEFKPVRYIARQPREEVLFCGCKHSAQPPFCDGAHNNLREAENDDPLSPANRAIPEVFPGPDGRAVLDGGCHVTRVDSAPRETLGNLTLAPVISAATGARFQSQFCLVVPPGQSPIMAWGDRHLILMITAGSGSVDISGRQFAIQPETGVYIRPGEAVRLHNSGDDELRLFATLCPLGEAPEILAVMPDNFDHSWPQRTVATLAENRKEMGNRFWQILVDKAVGSTMATQFIGEIPPSKAMPHRHLYEESLVVLGGAGYMWTENARARVRTGDIIFLPRKQLHSLQCTDPAGMYLSGIIYPGDNPTINYY